MTRAQNLWPHAVALALGLHLGLIGAGVATGLFTPPGVEAYGAEDAIDIAPVVAAAQSEFVPQAAEVDAEDRAATPKLDETLSKKTDQDLPTEQASPQEAETDLRMAQESTRKTTQTPKEDQQATEAMQQQAAQAASQASLAAEEVPDSAGPDQDHASAPEAGQSLEARRRLEAWHKKLVAHLIRFKRYPPQARARRLKGQSEVVFVLDAAGVVSLAQLGRGSGHSVLDAAALDWITRASPVPAPPREAIGRPLSLPMRFTAP